MGSLFSRNSKPLAEEPKIVVHTTYPPIMHRPTTLSSTFQYILEIEELKEGRGNH